MGTNSKIEWCDHTFNPWRGCTKVSAGCANCYAETLSHRNPGTLGIWGNLGTRVVAAESMWREPLKWDRAAREAGEVHRVFCASLADVFEDWTGAMMGSNGHSIYILSGTGGGHWWRSPNGGIPADNGAITLGMKDVRRRLAMMISATPNLEWLLLTKRPENADRMLAEMFGPIRGAWPGNFRVGASVEDQAAAEARLPHLLALDVPNFLSVEPLLSPIDLKRYLPRRDDDNAMFLTAAGHDPMHWGIRSPSNSGLDWVICGGESGPDARPMHENWVRDIREQCVSAGVPLLFKQWGQYVPMMQTRCTPGDSGIVADDFGPKGGFPESRVHYWPDGSHSYRAGKKESGRLLDGRTWDQFPETAR